MIRTRCALVSCLGVLLTLLTTLALWASDGAVASAASCPKLTYRSAPALNAQRACMNEGVQTTGTQPGTYLFLSQNGANGAGAGIFQDNGVLVWWLPGHGVKDHDMTVVHYQGQPYAALWSGGGAPDGSYGIGSVTLYDEHYNVAGHITAPNSYGAHGIDLHEFQVTPQGDALIGSYVPERKTVNGHTETVLGYLVEKLSLVKDSSGIHTGKVLFAWNSLNDIPVSDSYVPDPGAGGIYDYFHGNGITQDTDGNLLVTARNTWGIYKIDDTPNTAHFDHVIWQVGAKHDHQLSEPWCYQHDIAALGNNTYSLYDDGGTGPGCLPGSTQHPARGVIFSVDPSETPAGVQLVRAYTHNPPIYTGFTGSMQPLSNGDALIDWANVPEITEYDASGNTVKMDLSLSNWSYRGFRFAWDGQPTAPPSAAAQLASADFTLWASWNGSTETTAWQPLAGTDPAKLSKVGGPTPKGGFETSVSTTSDAPFAAVQALNSSGTVLGTSRAVPTSDYLLTTARGNVYNFGNAGWYGSKNGSSLPAAVTGIAAAPGAFGYWLATAKGNVYNFGAARWYGSKNGSRLPASVVGIATTPDGHGYWLVTAAGNVYNFGDAGWYGSKNGSHLPGPVVAMATTPDGKGYWLVTAAGNVYNFGDAGWYGSKNGSHLPAPVVGIAKTPDGHGYWLTTAKGNVYQFGDGAWYGSEGSSHLSSNVTGIAATLSGHGYWLTTAAGNVYNFGNAGFYGSKNGTQLPAGITGITSG
jgi:hypothetical protein